MDLDSLRCFDAAATTLRFRAAAARVHLSPAAFSDRIRRLEANLGVALLEADDPAGRAHRGGPAPAAARARAAGRRSGACAATAGEKGAPAPLRAGASAPGTSSACRGSAPRSARSRASARSGPSTSTTATRPDLLAPARAGRARRGGGQHAPHLAAHRLRGPAPRGVPVRGHGAAPRAARGRPPR